MIDQSLIRRAVELADGWLTTDDPNGEPWIEGPDDISPPSPYRSYSRVVFYLLTV